MATNLLKRRTPAAPDLDAATQERDAAVAAWRAATAAQQAAADERQRLGTYPAGATRLERLQHDQQVAPAQQRANEADIALEEATVRCRAAEATWRAAYIAAVEPEGRELFARMADAGASLTAVVDAYAAWSRAHDPALLHSGPVSITEGRGPTRPRWGAGIPPWFVVGDGPSAWAHFVAHVRTELGW